jgi:hypothetical protein
MTRTQLRKLLVDKVKLEYDFFIASCNHEEASINIKIPKDIKDNSGSIYDYSLEGLCKQDRLKHKKTISKVKDIINNCKNKLEKFKFKNIIVENFNISFLYPIQYRTKKKLSYNDICCIMESYVPNSRFF